MAGESKAALVRLSIFDNDFSTYLFEGLRENASELHITSTNFDEPIGVAQAKAHDYVLAVHGYKGELN